LLQCTLIVQLVLPVAQVAITTARWGIHIRDFFLSSTLAARKSLISLETGSNSQTTKRA
jgi:hypothetical protein